MRIEQFGPLRCRLAGGTDGEGAGTGPVLVLCHGFGAPGDDLVSLWRAIDAPPGTRFVFPEAPLSLSHLGYGEGRAWWMIDLERFQRSIALGRPRELARQIPAGLDAARSRLQSMLDDLTKRFDVSFERMLVGGFSQGAMLACDLVLRSAQPFAGLVLLSGSIVAEDEWRPRWATRRGLRVFQSHGREDPLLPFSVAEELRELARGEGLEVDWHAFHGGHGIPGPVIDRLGEFARAHLRG